MLCELCRSEHDEDVLCSNVFCEEEVPTKPLERRADLPRDLVGQTLGNYRLVRRLGAGGMGTVYLAEQTLIQARVAVKVLHPHLGQDESLRARFYAEARAVNLVGHPNLVRIFDISEAPSGLHYFVMEYLEGQPLARFSRPMEPRLLTHLLGQACDALDAAHRADVVHRDLKPDNLYVVQRKGEPPSLKVLDFGVAKARGALGPSHQTVAGMVLGTPTYMAPEQWTGQPVDGRADIYALGVTGYCMATGQLPFKRGQVAERAVSRGSGGPTPPHVLNPHLPTALSEVLLQALAWSPEDRFASALDFKRALQGELPALPRVQPASPVLAPARQGHTPVPDPTIALRSPRPQSVPREPTTPIWMARVHRRSGAGVVDVPCTALSRGGLLMCCAEPFPRLFTRLEFSLLLEGEEVACVGEVVRHVDAAQARAWDMRPGIGLQFVSPSPRLRALLQKTPTPRPVSDGP